MRRIFLFAAFAAALILGAGRGTLFAQRGTTAQREVFKLASPLPRESPWGRTLERIAGEWNTITRGQVQFRISHNGIEGDEERMHQSLRSDNIQAAVFTSFGLSIINPSVLTMSAPFLIRNDAELDAVMREVQTDLEARLNTDQYFLMAWSKAGFANFFSRDPVFTPDDLRRQKIGSSPEAGDINTVFKSMGFLIEESTLVDMGQKVATGAVGAVYITPAGAAPYQLHTQLKNMLSTNIAPVLGGIVINQVTWRKIGAMDPNFQREMLRVIRQISDEFDASMPRLSTDAINAMSRAGLTVNRPSAAQEQLWFNEIDRVIPALLGSAYDRDLYQRINDILRRQRGGR